MLAHKLHFTASKSDVSVTAGGTEGVAKLNQLMIDLKLVGGVGIPLRGTIEIALYGHWVAQSAQPMQVSALISTCPSAKRAIAPVGHPVRHSGSWQCRHADGIKTC